MIHYVAVLIPDREDGGYAVLFPDLPGCVTQGEDMAEAQEMAVDALSLWMASAAEHGDRIPAPRDLAAIKADKAFARIHGIAWKDATAVMIPVRPPLGRPERVNVSLDSNKLRAIDAYATRRGLTRSAVLEAGAELLIGHDPMPPRGRARVGRNEKPQAALGRDQRAGKLGLAEPAAPYAPPARSGARRKKR